MAFAIVDITAPELKFEEYFDAKVFDFYWHTEQDLIITNEGNINISY